MPILLRRWRYRLIFGYLAVSSFVSGVLWYGLLRYAGLSWTAPYVFFPVYRMPMYPSMYPLQYIAVVSCVFAVVGVLWCRVLSSSAGWWRAVTIVLALALTITIASIPGGVLWAIHDMHNGFVPSPTVIVRDVLRAASSGPLVGWYIVLLSVPYGALCALSSAWLLHNTRRLLPPSDEA